jgi:hypothetical protein
MIGHDTDPPTQIEGDEKSPNERRERSAIQWRESGDGRDDTDRDDTERLQIATEVAFDPTGQIPSRLTWWQPAAEGVSLWKGWREPFWNLGPLECLPASSSASLSVPE